MAILTGEEIKKQSRIGNIYISDFDESRLGPNSYDITLHNELLVYDDSKLEKISDGPFYENCRYKRYDDYKILDCKKENPTKSIFMDDSGFILRPGTLYLGRTVEKTSTTGFAPMIEGRSSIGRLGINIHATAGFGDNGFEGYWTLEISCIQPVRIYPGIRIGQLYYHTLEGDTKRVYNGKYQYNESIQGSQLFKDF